MADQHNAKIEASRSHGMVRITGDFQTCRDALKSIDSQLRLILSGEMDFSHDRDLAGDVDTKDLLYPLSRSFVKEVERLTSTAIEMSSNKKV